MLPNFFFGGEKEVSDRGGTAAGAGYSRAAHVPYCSSQLGEGEEEGGENFILCALCFPWNCSSLRGVSLGLKCGVG